jgi:hypothetical protein
MERISSNCILLDSGEEVATFKLFCQAPATSQQVIRVPAWGVHVLIERPGLADPYPLKLQAFNLQSCTSRQRSRVPVWYSCSITAEHTCLDHCKLSSTRVERRLRSSAGSASKQVPPTLNPHETIDLIDNGIDIPSMADGLALSSPTSWGVYKCSGFLLVL